MHTWCTRAAHVLHTWPRGSSVDRQCVDVGAVGSGAQRQTEVSGWRSHDVVLKSGLSAEREAEVTSWPSDVIVQISVPWGLAVRVTRISLAAEGKADTLRLGLLLASSDDKASQLRKSAHCKTQSATRKSQAGRQSTGDNGVRKFGVDKGVRKFDVSAKTKRAFRISLPTAFNLCPTAGVDQTVVRRFLDDAGLH